MWKKDTNHMKPILQIYTGGFFFAKNVLLCYFYAACILARHITHTHYASRCDSSETKAFFRSNSNICIIYMLFNDQLDPISTRKCK